MRRVLIGTGNRGKVAEYRAILAGLPIELVAPEDLEVPIEEPAEDFATFRENAVAKARAYARATRMEALADDSGLEVAALRGAPGVRSRRFFGDVGDAERNAKLLALLDGVADRSARFVCAIALARPDGGVAVFEGEVAGRIAAAPRGTNGFGYDPIFLVEAGERTMAELSPAEKHARSHRGRAGALLRAHLAASA